MTEKIKKCFVIMAIGDQPDGTTAAVLRARYTDVIRAAMSSRKDIQVKRADDAEGGGSITDEILEDILTSDYVVADISYPNPNVFYELGLRHAAHPSATILVRHRNAPSPPFDISVLRYHPYDDSATGLRELQGKLERHLDSIDAAPGRPDNQVQLVASRLGFRFPDYGTSPYQKNQHDVEMLSKLFSSKKLLAMMKAKKDGEDQDPMEMVASLAEDPDLLKVFLSIYMTTGGLNLKKMLGMPDLS